MNCDHVFRVPHLPQPGETLTARSVSRVSGGKGANQAVAAARLGADVTLVAAVGDDDDGRFVIREVTAAGVQGDAIATHDDAQTGAAYINVADDGENHIVLAPGANATLDATAVERHRDKLRQADVILLQLETTTAAVEATLAAIPPRGERTPRVILDPAPASDLPDAVLRQVDVISPNQTEAAVFVGDGSPEEQARRLADRTGAAVFLKLGEAGTLGLIDGRTVRQTPPEVEVVDTTAAGDAFTAALAIGLHQLDDPQQAARLACAAGAAAVTTDGAQPSLPTRDAVDTLLNRF